MQLLTASVQAKVSASAVCRQLLEDYLAADEKPGPTKVDPDLPRATRSLYIQDDLWEAVRLGMIQERRSASSLLEQLIRTHLGLDPGRPIEIQQPDHPGQGRSSRKSVS